MYCRCSVCLFFYWPGNVLECIPCSHPNIQKCFSKLDVTSLSHHHVSLDQAQVVLKSRVDHNYIYRAILLDWFIWYALLCDR